MKRGKTNAKRKPLAVVVEPVVRKILRGISAYKIQQLEILDCIQKYGGRLHQDDFDKEFSDFEEKQMPDGMIIRCMKIPRIWAMTGDSFILGSMQQPGDWAKYLDLTHLMVKSGLLRIEGKPPNVTYIANPTEQGTGGIE